MTGDSRYSRQLGISFIYHSLHISLASLYDINLLEEPMNNVTQYLILTLMTGL